MKAQEHRIEDLRQSRFEADLEARINGLFRRCPALCGFAVRDAAHLSRDGLPLDHASELFLSEVSVYPFNDLRAPEALCTTNRNHAKLPALKKHE